MYCYISRVLQITINKEDVDFDLDTLEAACRLAQKEVAGSSDLTEAVGKLALQSGQPESDQTSSDSSEYETDSSDSDESESEEETESETSDVETVVCSEAQEKDTSSKTTSEDSCSLSVHSQPSKPTIDTTTLNF